MLKCLENIFAINLDQKPIATNKANENIAGGRQSSGRRSRVGPGGDRLPGDWEPVQARAAVPTPPPPAT